MYKNFIRILQEELLPAQGCTEPIALAYCAAKAREVLGKLPEHIDVKASSNIIKNVKSVVVPNTCGRKGIEAACVFGAVAGDPGKQLEVLTEMDENARSKAEALLDRKGYCSVAHLASDAKLHIIVAVSAGPDCASVEIKHTHTNITRIEKNGFVIYDAGTESDETVAQAADKSFLTVQNILSFAQEVPIELIRTPLERQLTYNMAISEDGLKNNWGAHVGSTILEYDGCHVYSEVQARAAAGSDARMSGSVLPVVINSGSGNQGLTVSLPVVVYAKHIGADREKTIRALAVSNLIAIHLKEKIGRLSAYCGAVSAAAGSGAAIAWLDASNYDTICATITNTLATVSGIVCDGAKPSCAAKIAVAIDAAMMGYEMAKRDHVFQNGEGIVKNDIESTIAVVGDIASRGMIQTDDVIIHAMLS